MALNCTPQALNNDLGAYQSHHFPADIRCVVPAGVLDVPLATTISLATRTPLVLVRNDDKDYGTGNVIEGELPASGTVVLVWGYSTNEVDPMMAAMAVRKAAPMAYVIWYRAKGSK